jgi:hypothetical protein
LSIVDYNGEPVGGGEYSIWRSPKVSIVDFNGEHTSGGRDEGSFDSLRCPKASVVDYVDVNSLEAAGCSGRSADGFGDNTGAYEAWHPSAPPEQGRRASGVRRTSGTLAGEASSGERAKW